MSLDPVLQTFFIESRELLEAMEDALLRVEEEQDADLINAIFRAAHTIKGSAGLFGLDDIVGFTHVVESVLDKVRNGELSIDSELAAALLSCRDHIGELVEAVANDQATLDNTTQERSETLIGQLHRYLDADMAVPAIQVAEPVAAAEDSASGSGNSECWHISLRLDRESLRNGMDPLAFIRYLGTFGTIIQIEAVQDALPAAAEMDPECCYLGFEIAFKSNADKATIEGVFDFVREGSQIHILPPYSNVEDYIRMIAQLPEDDVRLGEILVRCGAVTRNELDEALKRQLDDTQSAPIGQVLVDNAVVHDAVVEAAVEKQKQVKEAKAQESQSIRVDAAKLDRLINLVGELVIGGAGTNLLAQRFGIPQLLEATSSLSRLVEEIRDSTLQLRMVEIGETFNRFKRVVRDVSKELGKDIALEISGAETELDKSVVEKIGDPLMHLVRNAMDHGIERAEVREAHGKPVRGTLRLNAYHDSGSIVIEVVDDGGGLNRDRILNKAVERGLVNSGQSLADQDIFGLIFEPGFSTAEQVTNLSGRGVGMDVVKRNITALRGTIEIDSKERVGTTIRIRLPLTLAIIDGFLVGVGKSSFVIPLEMVLECVELTPRDRAEAHGRSYINLRGEVLPFIRMRDVFEINGTPARRENVVVVQYAGRKAGLMVDELLGEFQTVIKPLGKLFGGLKGFSGSTILGTGEVALIMDVPALVHQVANSEIRELVAE